MVRWSTSCVNEPAATEDAQALKKKPRPNEKCEAGSPSQEFNSPRVRKAPIPCTFGAWNIRAAPAPTPTPTNPPIISDLNKIIKNISYPCHYIANIFIPFILQAADALAALTHPNHLPE